MAGMNDPTRAADAAGLDLLRRWVKLLDDRFRIPGTNIRFGIDPLIGLIPGLGEATSPVFTVALLVQGVRMRVPRVVLARMVVHAGVDALLGVIPFAGNVVDVFWRANRRNLTLLERHARPGVPPTRADYVFIWAAVAFIVLLAAIPIVVLVFLANKMDRLAFF
jgi:hypothetical protein